MSIKILSLNPVKENSHQMWCEWFPGTRRQPNKLPSSPSNKHQSNASLFYRRNIYKFLQTGTTFGFSVTGSLIKLDINGKISENVLCRGLSNPNIEVTVLMLNALSVHLRKKKIANLEFHLIITRLYHPLKWRSPNKMGGNKSQAIIIHSLEECTASW